jgi:hypothetical protein
MTPYDTYRLYQLEHAKTAAQTRYADEQAGRLAAATSALLRGIIRRARALRPLPVTGRASVPRPAGPAGRRSMISETMEG